MECEKGCVKYKVLFLVLEKHLWLALGGNCARKGLHVAEPALFFSALRASQFHAKIMVIPATSGGLMTTRPLSALI